MRATAEFDAFFAATAPRMVRHLYLATGDLGRAQECVQEAYARLWRRWEQVGHSDADRVAWVRTVAWRLAITDVRRRAAYARALARHGAPPDTAGPSPNAVAVRDALARLPYDQRAVLVMHYFTDMPVAAIAQLLDVPIGTVKARLSRGRTALGRLLGDDDSSASEGAPWART